MKLTNENKKIHELPINVQLERKDYKRMPHK
ncbi:hypothetical protein GGD38_000181 [Chitinophagaceae bacterium OAS944]|nr:hypothetical protein [Chitinophagaceae bacterium OAS944]